MTKTVDHPRPPVICAVCGLPGRRTCKAQMTCGELRCIREHRRRHAEERHKKRKKVGDAGST